VLRLKVVEDGCVIEKLPTAPTLYAVEMTH
jgi:hypothetical protein